MTTSHYFGGGGANLPFSFIDAGHQLMSSSVRLSSTWSSRFRQPVKWTAYFVLFLKSPHCDFETYSLGCSDCATDMIISLPELWPYSQCGYMFASALIIELTGLKAYLWSDCEADMVISLPLILLHDWLGFKVTNDLITQVTFVQAYLWSDHATDMLISLPVIWSCNWHAYKPTCALIMQLTCL